LGWNADRPSFDAAARPEEACRLYENIVSKNPRRGLRRETGEFQANDGCGLVNQGPVRILIDSEKTF